KAFLPLPHHAKRLIIHDYNLNRQLSFFNDRQFLCCHLEATVTDERYYQFIRCAKLRANCSREAESHCSESARGNPLVWIGKRIILCRPHLVLSDVCCDNRFA